MHDHDELGFDPADLVHALLKLAGFGLVRNVKDRDAARS